MEFRQLVYKSKTSPVKYIIPATFVLLSIATYFFKLHYFIVGVFAFLALKSAFNDTLTIKVFTDGFEFTYSNIFGQLFAINHRFLYSQINNYKCEITQWQANLKQAAIMTSVEAVLPGRTRTRFRKDPEAHISMDIKNQLNEVKKYEHTLILNEWTHREALDIISRELSKR